MKEVVLNKNMDKTRQEKVITEKFKEVLSRLFYRHPFDVLDTLRNICLTVFWGVKMGYTDDEIIKFCMREVHRENDKEYEI